MALVETKNLLEREVELAVLGSRLEAARTGVGCLLVVEGPAGIGKTQLLQAAGGLASAGGMGVVAARGAQLEREFAFGVVRQLFEPLLRASSAAERAALLTGSAGLVRPLLDLDAPSRPPRGDPVFSMLHGLFWLCVNLADRAPVAIVVDDAQWADAASRRFLSYLTARLEGLSIAIVAAWRTGEPEASDERTEGAESDLHTEVLRPAELSADAVAELVASEYSTSPDDEFCQACHSATSGNPFLVHELLRALGDEGVAPTSEAATKVAEFGPRGVARWVLVRISHLSDAAVGLAQALAVLGDGCQLPTAARLAAMNHETAVTAADLLRQAEVLRPARDLEFAHPIVRSAIYTDLPPARRAQMHSEAARLLDHARATPERIAAQLLATDPAADDWTVTVLRHAAHQALARGAPDTATTYLQRALHEPPTPEQHAHVLRELGTAELTSHQPAAIAHLKQALESTSDVKMRANIAQLLGLTLTLADDIESAVPVLDRALAELGDANPEVAKRIEAQLMQTALTGGRHTTALTRVRSRPLGDGLSDRMLLASLAGLRSIEAAPADQVHALADRALGGGELLDDAIGSQIVYMAITALMVIDQLELAADWLDRALTDARIQGSVINYVTASACRADVNYRMGDLTQAEAHGRAAVEAAGFVTNVTGLWAISPLTDTLIDRGDIHGGEHLFADEVSGLIERHGMPHRYVLAAHGRLRVAQGRGEEGLADLLSVARWCDACGVRNPGLFAWRSSAAMAYRQLGEDHDARRLAHEEVELARPLGHPRALGIALRAAGLVEGGDRGIELLQEAVSVLDHSPARLEHARALTDLGATLRRTGHRSESREPLRLGLDFAHRCGATALVERARQELLATGARPRRPMITGRDALTPTEARIARMAAEGHSTPAIAQALFVTPKTVETHLGHAYQKLNIHSRTELPTALAASHEAKRTDRSIPPPPSPPPNSRQPPRDARDPG